MAQDMASLGVDIASDKIDGARKAAGEHSLKQLKQSLEGSKAQMGTAPDVYVTILEVQFQDNLDVDIMNFKLSGLKCKVQLDVIGTAAQLAGMVAADTASKIADKAAGYLGMAASLVGQAQAFKDNLHATAKDGSETKSLVVDINLDLGVRKAGEEVTTAVSIVGDALDHVDKVIPVKTATLWVEQAIAKKVKEVITAWAKETVKNKTGVDVDRAKQAATQAKDQAKVLADQAKAKLGLS